MNKDCMLREQPDYGSAIEKVIVALRHLQSPETEPEQVTMCRSPIRARKHQACEFQLTGTTNNCPVSPSNKVPVLPGVRYKDLIAS